MNNNGKTSKTQAKGVFFLLITAFIWGTSFVAQSIGMEKIEAFTFNGIRTVMGGLFLLPVIFIRELQKRKEAGEKDKKVKNIFTKKALKYGIILGLIFFTASNFQQFAFYYSTAGKIAFITALYMIFVPIIGLFIGKNVPILTWICVVFGFIGTYFLCIKPGQSFNVNKGDLLALVCAFVYAIHILSVEKFSKEVDGVLLSCLQFFVGGGLSLIMMFIFETPVIANILVAAKPLLYSGIMSCGIAYTLQIVGQKYTEATIASLLMCMESVFAVITSAIVLHEFLTGREITGCIIMFAAIVISQIPTKTNN
ncbi:MAG: DMT family transporter [Lachnospiraceae bacterium]|nr:DMT family transporter [Lachnospiraceae bacterium]